MDKVKKANYVKAVFDDIANKYDKMNLLLTWGMISLWQKKVMHLTELKPGDNALDVCCGTGEMTYKLAKRVGNFGSAIGIDFSEKMLEVAKAKQQANSVLPIEFVQGDAMSLPFQDNLFDAATNGFALRNVGDIKACLGEMARVVKKGGKVVCIDVSRPKFPVFRLLFNLYYFHVVPWIGQKIGSSNEIEDSYAPYTWLAESLRNFPSRKGIIALYEAVGMTEVKAYPVGFGAATIYVGNVE